MLTLTLSRRRGGRDSLLDAPRLRLPGRCETTSWDFAGPPPSSRPPFAAPPKVGGPGAEILQPLPEVRKDGLSLKTELLTGPAEAMSITERAGV